MIQSSYTYTLPKCEDLIIKSARSINSGDLDEGRKCMETALRIFREENPERKFDGKIILLDKCITLVNTTKSNLGYVTDLLNGHDILSPGTSTDLTTWLEEKAAARLRKCIVCLEVHLINAGIELAKETKNLLYEANTLHKSYIEKQDKFDYLISYNNRRINTLDTCIRLLQEPEKHLSMVILILKGKMPGHALL